MLVFSVLAVLVSAFADFVPGDDVVFVLPVALTVVVFGPFDVAPAFVVFGDAPFAVVPFDDTCWGFVVGPLLPCAETIADDVSTNAAAETSAIIVRVMNPPRGHSPNHP